MGNPLSYNACVFWSAIIDELTNEILDPEILHPLSVDFEKIRQITKLGMDEQLLAMMELERLQWIVVQRKMNGKVDWVITADVTKKEALLIMGESEGHREENGECFACSTEYTAPGPLCQEKKQSPAKLFDLYDSEPDENPIYQPLIDYWTSKQFSKPQPSRYKEVVEAFESIDPPVTFASFKTAVDNFSLSAWNEYYWPVEKHRKKLLQKMSLIYFLTKEAHKNTTAYKNFLKNKPSMKLYIDHNPQLTQTLIKKFQRVFDPNGLPLGYSVYDTNQFTIASNYLSKIIEKFRKTELSYINISDDQFAEDMIQALKEKKPQNAMPNDLTSNYFLKTIFPEYLKSQHSFVEDREEPIEYKIYTGRSYR